VFSEATYDTFGRGQKPELTPLLSSLKGLSRRRASARGPFCIDARSRVLHTSNVMIVTFSPANSNENYLLTSTLTDNHKTVKS
jgi:hypothetical protein